MATLQFQVKLENVDLTKTQISTLEKEINAVVGKHVAKAVPAASKLGSKLKINPEWLGIWLKKFKDIDALKNNINFKRFNR
jgi:hypothetical protein